MKRPIFWPLLGLLIGIYLVRFFSFSSNVITLSVLISLIVLCVSAFKKYFVLLSFSILLLFSSFGYWSARKAIEQVDHSSFLSQIGDEKVYWGGKVLESCELTERGSRYEVEVLEIKENEKILSTRGKVLLTVAGEEYCGFQYGDLIQSHSKFKLPDYFHNPYAFDYPFYLKTKGLIATTFVDSRDFVVKRGEQVSYFHHFLSDYREKIIGQLNKLHPEESQLLLKALILGFPLKAQPELQALFRKTGTTHLIVVSGFHLVMLAGFFYFLFRFFFSLYPTLLLKFSVRRLSVLASLPFVFFYAFLVGLSPTVLRALAGVCLFAFLLVLRKRQDALSVLFLIAFGILFVFPLMLFDAGFQLSFLSLLAILIVFPPCKEFVEKKCPLLSEKRFLKYFVEIVLVSISVQIVLFPYLVNTFHQVSWVAVIANLILIPYFSFVLMPLGMMALFWVDVFPSLSKMFFSLSAFFSQGTFQILKILSFPGSWVYLPRMSLFQVLFYFLLLFCVFFSFSRKRKVCLILLLILINFGFCFYPHWKEMHQKDFRLSFLDVGQGDSILLQFPGGTNMLVDAGGMAGSSFDVGEKVLIPTLLGRGITHLDYLVLTHPHPDHMGGMAFLLNVYHPKEFWWNGEGENIPEMNSLLNALRQKNIPLLKKDAQSLPVNIGGVKIDFLHPASNTFFPEHPDAATLNNHSLVMKFTDRQFSVLLTGDLQKEAEEEILTLNPGSVDLLKVAHHGSQTSSNPPFLEVIKPRYAMIEVGRHNPFGFPRPEVLSRYENLGIKVFRSDEMGEVDFSWNGSKLKIHCEMNCKNP